jgi:hypothetical protein
MVKSKEEGLPSMLTGNRFMLDGGNLAIWQGNALHFLDLTGNETAPPLAAPTAWDGHEYPLWVQTASGHIICQFYSPEPALPGKLAAITAQGSVLWQSEVAADFDLVAASDEGFVYGVMNRAEGQGFKDSWWAEADIVCLRHVEPSP